MQLASLLAGHGPLARLFRQGKEHACMYIVGKRAAPRENQRHHIHEASCESVQNPNYVVILRNPVRTAMVTRVRLGCLASTKETSSASSVYGQVKAGGVAPFTSFRGKDVPAPSLFHPPVTALLTGAESVAPAASTAIRRLTLLRRPWTRPLRACGCSRPHATHALGLASSALLSPCCWPGTNSGALAESVVEDGNTSACCMGLNSGVSAESSDMEVSSPKCSKPSAGACPSMCHGSQTGDSGSKDTSLAVTPF